MNRNFLILTLLVGMGGLAAGFLTGRATAPEPSSVSVAPARNSDLPHKPLPRLSPQPALVQSSSGRYDSVQEVLRKLQELGSAMHHRSPRIQLEIQEVLRRIHPDNFAEVLAEAERILPSNVRHFVRWNLFSHWADTDLAGAMAAADRVKGENLRTEAIINVWARGRNGMFTAPWTG
jgi:hypothetical protein